MFSLKNVFPKDIASEDMLAKGWVSLSLRSLARKSLFLVNLSYS